MGIAAGRERERGEEGGRGSEEERVASPLEQVDIVRRAGAGRGRSLNSFGEEAASELRESVREGEADRGEEGPG